jgi:hypothetical protein
MTRVRFTLRLPPHLEHSARFSDWVSWIYVPILVPILILLPYFVVQYHKESKRAHQIMKSLAQGSRDLEQMTRLLHAPVTPWKGQQAEELPGTTKWT